jgi:RNA polymerase primary sigma factor
MADAFSPLGDEEQGSLGDLIEDRETPSPVEAAIRDNLGELTRKVLATLTPREEQIVRMRFVLADYGDRIQPPVRELPTAQNQHVRKLRQSLD